MRSLLGDNHHAKGRRAIALPGSQRSQTISPKYCKIDTIKLALFLKKLKLSLLTMTDLYFSPQVAANNQQSLKRLHRAISLSQGQFSLIVACCNHQALRQQMAQRLEALVTGQIQELVLNPSFQKLYTTIQANCQECPPQALMIFGLESVEKVESLLISTNFVRNEFSKKFSFPIVLWVNDEILSQLVRLAPDFKSWAASTIRFVVTEYANPKPLTYKLLA